MKRILLVLLAGNVFVWAGIFGGSGEKLEIYFLDVGQGDSQLINYPGGVQVLIDGGRGPQVLTEIAKVLPAGDRYIDLVILTHPDFDHFGGLIDVLKTYQVGAVILNGRKGVAAAYADFEKAVRESGAKAVNLMEGDGVRYGEHRLYVLSPNLKNLNHKKVNESGLVILQKSLAASGGRDLKVLYTADIGFETERELARKYDLSADVLKVGHHGSKFSSSAGFLKAVNPKISVIEVGKNTYGHPTGAALGRLADIGSKIFRTDLGGTIKLIFDGKTLKLYN